MLLPPDRREKVLASAGLALLALALVQDSRIRELKTVLAAKPKIEYREKIVEKRVEVKVAGPVRIVEKIVTRPDGASETTRETFREATRTESGTERASEQDRKEAPMGLPARSHPRWAHVALDPFGSFLPRRASAGLTLWDRLDVG